MLASLSRSHSNQGSTTWAPESGSLHASPHLGRGSEATKVGTGLGCFSRPRPPTRIPGYQRVLGGQKSLLSCKSVKS